MPHLILRLVLFACVIAAVFFASVPLWAWGAVMALIGLALGSWFYCYGRGSVTIEMKRWQLIVLFLPPLLVVLWSLLQASTISPGPWNNPIWREASQALATDIPGHVSLTPDKAAALLARLGMYAGVFWLAANLGRDPENARNAIATTGWAVTVIAFYGLVVYFSGAERILWMRKYAYIGDLTATFVNRNNYATFAGMGLVCVVARAFNSIYDYINISKNKLERTRNFISFIERRGAIYLLQVLIIFSSILLSHSRAGLVSTICGVFVIFVAFSFSRLDLGKLPLRATIAFVVVGIVFYAASGQGIDARLGSTDIAGEERPLVYQLTIRAISDQPLFGTGLGSFEDVFRLYRSAKVLSVYDYAHDTYLETALELGVPSLILLALSIGAAIIECARGVRVRRRDLIYPCIGVGVSGLVWTHALVDFSIQIPAVAVSYAMLMGIAVAQSRSSRE